jgi:hypothetical protein
MSTLMSRYALRISVAAAMLAGCGGSQPPVGAPGPMPQSHALATNAGHGKSWMLPEAKSEDLLYAGGSEQTYVFSWPGGKSVGELGVASTYLCSDRYGNIWALSRTSVNKYAHGGTTPIATIIPPSGTEPIFCAVDSTTGNLALFLLSNSHGEVAVYPDAQGQPVIYSPLDPSGIGYDAQGNLFISGYRVSQNVLGELPVGGSQFVPVTLNGNGQKFDHLGPLQWHGHYLALEGNLPNAYHGKEYELSLSGSAATVVKTFQYRPLVHGAWYSWIEGRHIAIPFQLRGHNPYVIGIWRYPGGGEPQKILKTFDGERLVGGVESVTVSVAESH